MTIDFKKNQWTRGFCTDKSKNASPNPKQPLDERSGTLTTDNRALIETEYAKLVREPGPSCGADVGRIELTLRHGSGSTVLVNAGSSCGNAPPEVAKDLGAFNGKLFTIAHTKPNP
jgi:hypothetical protein